MLDYAIKYRKLGWSVIPVRRDKKPLIRWSDFQKRIATEEEIKEWWHQWPEANIALVTGAISGIVAIDIDSVYGQEAFIGEFGDLYDTIQQFTGKPDARHLLFKHPRDGTVISNMGRVIRDIDIRGDGGYIIIAPSIHLSGKKYEWGKINPLADGLEDLWPIPEELYSIFKKEKASSSLSNKKSKNQDGWFNDTILHGVAEGERNEKMTKIAGELLRTNNGDKNLVLGIMMDINIKSFNPPLGWEELKTILNSIAKKEKKKKHKYDRT